MKIFVSFSAASILLSSCGSPHKTDPQIQAIIDSLRMDSAMSSGSSLVEDTLTAQVRDSAGWNGTIRFSITGTEQTPAGRILFAEAGTGDQKEGINIALPLPDDETKDGPEKNILISSAGKTSDRLLHTMADLSGLKMTGKKFRKELRLACTDLQPVAGTGGMNVSKTGVAHFKLFHNPAGKPGEYFELYLDINEKEGWLELQERDENYRQAILETLTAK